MSDRSSVLLVPVAALAIAAAGSMAQAANPPAVKVSAGNAVPACATPGRLQAYLATRNSSVPSQFETIAVEYMKHGEALGVRWDYAFFQMLVETGSLSFKNGNRQGDVRPAQNNFAGLGATGNGERGESFPDVSTGARAHLEHILLYAGAPVENPVAERTRKVHEWGVLTNWYKGFKRPITFADLGQKWAPGTKTYFSMIEDVADKFYDDLCKQADPKPELVAMARGKTVVASAAAPADKAADIAEKPSGKALAKAAIERGGAERKFALGAAGLAKSNAPPVKILNSPTEETAPAFDPPKADAAAEPDVPAKAAMPPAATKTAMAAGAAKAAIAPPAAKAPDVPVAKPAACKVFTASYGGQKAVIVKAVVDKVVNYTVLDVNEGQEKREAEAFISAYAKGGALAGEFATQSQALDKAFELCPEG